MKKSEKITEDTQLEQILIKAECEKDHLFFTRYFFKHRQNIKFIINWHHKIIADAVDQVIQGKIKNLVINVPPGSSKTELVIINFIARGLAINPRARFLHLSYSDDLALLNSQTAREIIRSDEFQSLWPLQISEDTKSKKRWNVMVDGKIGGGVYATSISGQITGFRAGHMEEGFTGCILLDDLLKPEDAFSRTKLNTTNRKLLTTIKSRKANPNIPIVLIMQRISENDPVDFIKQGNVPGEWTFIVIPALLDKAYIESQISPIYHSHIPILDDQERFSYWPYKEDVEELLSMERGDGTDQTGARISRHVFSSQYQQNPIQMGGNIIKGEFFEHYTILPKISFRKIYADTAQKTAERNDYSVFECWGMGENGKIYLLDMIRGKWEAPELMKRAIAFWHKQNAVNSIELGQLREMMVEDKSSGTGLIQSLGAGDPREGRFPIPISPIERTKDKLTRVMDVTPYIEARMVCIPEGAPFTQDFVTECEAFTSDDSHAHDDQIDPMCDAIVDLLAMGDTMRTWEALGKNA